MYHTKMFHRFFIKKITCPAFALSFNGSTIYKVRENTARNRMAAVLASWAKLVLDYLYRPP